MVDVGGGGVRGRPSISLPELGGPRESDGGSRLTKGNVVNAD